MTQKGFLGHHLGIKEVIDHAALRHGRLADGSCHRFKVFRSRRFRGTDQHFIHALG
jgi:hypothetical protein